MAPKMYMILLKITKKTFDNVLSHILLLCLNLSYLFQLVLYIPSCRIFSSRFEASRFHSVVNPTKQNELINRKGFGKDSVSLFCHTLPFVPTSPFVVGTPPPAVPENKPRASDSQQQTKTSRVMVRKMERTRANISPESIVNMDIEFNLREARSPLPIVNNNKSVASGSNRRRCKRN